LYFVLFFVYVCVFLVVLLFIICIRLKDETRIV